MRERDWLRYSRQVLFSGLGVAGQERLGRARVVIVGCGALGSFQAGALARAGVGHLRLVDRDYVEWSNLHRQWLFEERDAEQGLPKAIAAARNLERVNSCIQIEPVVADLTVENAPDLLGGVDLILDGTDNFETRYLVNDFSIRETIPWVYGAAVASYGLTMPVLPGRTACLKCIFPDPPEGAQPTCETAGVLNAVTAAIAALQVGDALKILAGKSDEVARRITTVDVWSGRIRQVDQPGPLAGCQACGQRRFQHLEETRRAPVSLCGRNAVQVRDRQGPLDLEDLKTRLAPLGAVAANEFALRFTVAPYEMTIFPDGRAIIKGTADVAVARSLYARYVGS